MIGDVIVRPFCLHCKIKHFQGMNVMDMSMIGKKYVQGQEDLPPEDPAKYSRNAEADPQ